MQVALDEENKKMIVTLLENQFDLNKNLADGLTPFIHALVKNPKLVPLLKKYGGLVEARHPSGGGTYLHSAAEKGDITLASVLLDNGASVNALDGRELTPIYRAIVNNKPAMVNFLFASGADLGKTPLHTSVVRGSLDSLRALLQLGASVKTKDENGQSPIWKAVERDDVGAASLLVDFGANLTERWYSSERTLLNWAAMKGSVRSIEWLVKNGLSVNSVNKYDYTPLHNAAYYGHLRAAQVLVGLGACLSCTNVNYDKPSDLAKQESHTDVVEYLNSVRTN